MPATLAGSHIAPVVPLPLPAPEPVRWQAARCCPVCAERRCADVSACRADFAAREWADCRDCAGSGFDTTEFHIWCPSCRGAAVVEVGA